MVVDALSRKPSLALLCGDMHVGGAYVFRNYILTMCTSKFFAFDSIKELYEHDLEFASIFVACEKGTFEKYYRHEGYLFKENRLCIPQGSWREVLVRESHLGG